MASPASPKALVILACSQKKGPKPVPARDLYLGSLFKLGRAFAEVYHYDYVILSAKHGLLHPEQVVAPYDQRIASNADVKRLQASVLPALQPYLSQYDKCFIIGGALYRKVLAPLMSSKFEVITDSRGIGGILQQLRRRISAGQ